jgi:HlyD family secretion protein
MTLTRPFFALGLMLLSGAVSAQEKPADPQPAAPPASAGNAGPHLPAVSVITAAERDLVARVAVTGTVVPREEILVSPEVEGLRISEILVEEGERVSKGQVLLRLSRETLEAQLAQVEAAMARAAATAAQSRSQIAEADATLTEANAALRRAQSLRTTGTASQEQLDQRTATARAATARLAAARDGLRAAEAAAVEADAQAREIRIRLSRTEVRAPADGLVAKRNAKLGALATAAGDPLFRLIQRGELDLAADVPEQRFTGLRIGQKALLTLPDGREVTGTVRLIAPQVDRTTRLGSVRIALPADSGAAAGNFMRGSVVLQTRRGIALPASAILFEDGRAGVQLVEDGRVRAVPIETGLVDSGQFEVVSGVRAGDVVVARSGTFLRSGDRVKPVDAAAATKKD